MDFTVDEKYRMLRETVRAFVEKEIEPMAQEWDEAGYVPVELTPKAAAIGLCGIGIPLEYGGSGWDAMASCIIEEEVARSATGVAMLVNPGLFSDMILDHGAEEQKRFYLPKIAKGECTGAFALTEASAGSDSANQQTEAVLDGDHYIINGSKTFITNAIVARYYVVLCKTDPSKGLKGISSIIVEKGTPGFTFGLPEQKMGIRSASVANLYFKDVKVPKKNLLGQEGRGFIQAMINLDKGRVTCAASALGIAQRAYELAVKYAKERITFGQHIIDNQAIQFMLVDMKVMIESARCLVDKCAWKIDNGLPFSTDSAIAKLYCSEVANKVCYQSLQIHGGYGYMKDYPIERLYRDARITEIYEGTSQIQKMVIGRSIMKEQVR